MHMEHFFCQEGTILCKVSFPIWGPLELWIIMTLGRNLKGTRMEASEASEHSQQSGMVDIVAQDLLSIHGNQVLWISFIYIAHCWDPYGPLVVFWPRRTLSGILPVIPVVLGKAANHVLILGILLSHNPWCNPILPISASQKIRVTAGVTEIMWPKCSSIAFHMLFTCFSQVKSNVCWLRLHIWQYNYDIICLHLHTHLYPLCVSTTAAVL